MGVELGVKQWFFKKNIALSILRDKTWCSSVMCKIDETFSYFVEVLKRFDMTAQLPGLANCPLEKKTTPKLNWKCLKCITYRHLMRKRVCIGNSFLWLLHEKLNMRNILVIFFVISKIRGRDTDFIAPFDALLHQWTPLVCFQAENKLKAFDFLLEQHNNTLIISFQSAKKTAGSDAKLLTIH